jgi:sugar phosphate isomerase/epimerase
MHNRRNFLKNSGAMALGGLLLSKHANALLFREKMTHAAGLQLFTLFSVMDKDPAGALKKISEIGYKEIESAFSMRGGYYGLKPKEFAALVKDSGMSWQSHHVLGAPFKMPPGGIKIPGADTTRQFTMPPMRSLKENAQELVDEAAEGGISYLVCASISHGTMDEIKEAVVILNKSGEACKKAGITFCYHNHTTEFEKVDGQLPYHIFLSQTSPDLVKMELDLGWATKAGVDPVELFKQHPGRFPLWHVKDLDKTTQQPTEIGTGTVNLKRIFDNAGSSGMKHFFVEQDGAPKPFENIATSFTNLSKIVA